MCRLFGIAGPGIQQPDIAAFIDMGIASQVNGKDAAGIFQTNTRAASKHNIHEDSYKTCGNFMELLDDLDTYSYSKPRVHQHLLSTVMVDVLMGHVRAKTRGRNTTGNAHPFYTKSLVGMHNGTLNSQRFHHAEKTDSEMMFLEMEWRGIVPTLNDMAKNDAYAVSVFSRETRTLIFATNGQRPLWFVNLKDRAVVYWSSEPAILRFALDRRGIQYFKPYPMPVNLIARLTPALISNKGGQNAWTKIADIEEKKGPEKKVIDTVKLLSDLSPKVDVSAVVKKEEEKVNNVLSFPPKAPEKSIPKEFERVTTRKRIPLNSFYTLQCKCGKKRLNLMQALLCRRGEIGSPKYDEASDTFECQDCVTEEKISNAD